LEATPYFHQRARSTIERAIVQGIENGHQLESCAYDVKSTGSFWSSHCVVCGAWLAVEYDESRRLIIAGGVARYTCAALLRKKLRRKERSSDVATEMTDRRTTVPRLDEEREKRRGHA
jgi:hypothetical protein